jgi:hypothetical protein
MVIPIKSDPKMRITVKRSFNDFRQMVFNLVLTLCLSAINFLTPSCKLRRLYNIIKPLAKCRYFCNKLSKTVKSGERARIINEFTQMGRKIKNLKRVHVEALRRREGRGIINE